MSFVSFLGQLAKVGLGYLGGGFLVLIGMMIWFGGNTIIGVPITAFGAILILFGIYSEDKM